MKHKILCSICNREFETEEETLEYDEAFCKYLPKEEIVCPDCQEDNKLT